MASLRAETASLVRLADRDLARLWRLVAAGAAADEALRDLLPAIVEQYGAAGAALAAEWYDEAREKAGVARAFTAVPIESSDRGSQALIGWALSEATDDAGLQALIAGGVQRRIADHVRGTIAGSSVADPSARGWQRVTQSGACWFCQSLSGRGFVYSESTAEFASHDHCGCSAVPAWRGKPVPVKPFTPSGRSIPEADKERFKQWAADRGLR